MAVALLIDAEENILDKLERLSYTPEIISPFYKLLDAKTVNQLQLNGFKVIPWTVNNTKDLKKMLDYQVDGIITDFPDRLIKLLQN